MKTKKEKEYLKKYLNAIQKHLKDFLQSQDQEALHQFRVQVKKTRSLLVLLEDGGDNKKLLRLFKPVKKVFKKAGSIREAYIHLRLGDQHHLHNDAFGKQQQQVVEKGTEAFCDKGHKHLHHLKKAKVKLNKAIHHIDNAGIQAFYNKTLNEIAEFLAQPVFDEGLHQCRKQIKYLLHNRKLAAKEVESLSFNTDYLDELQEMIGKWHDNLLAIELFSSSESEKASANNEIKAHNAELQKKITDKVVRFQEKVRTQALQ